MSRKPKLYCEEHGYRHFGLTCRHVRHGEGIRFYAIKLPDDHPAVWQAWCLECDSVVVAAGEMTEETQRFVDLQFVCMPCFKQAVRRNKRVRLAA